jgi:hypothetical protein
LTISADPDAFVLLEADGLTAGFHLESAADRVPAQQIDDFLSIDVGQLLVDDLEILDLLELEFLELDILDVNLDAAAGVDPEIDEIVERNCEI